MRRFRAGSWTRAVVLVVGVLAGCERADPSLQPDQLLRDSLGLGDGDRVHRVRVGSVANRETLDPATVQIAAGDYVEFVTQDRRVHAVAFELDSLDAGAAEFLRASGQAGSPPLVEADARFVVSFTDAPPGRYPYLVIGNGAQARGAIVVATGTD